MACHFFHPHLGGVERHVWQVAQELQTRGYEVEILTTQHQADLAQEEVLQGIKVHRFVLPQPEAKWRLFKTWLQLARFWRLFAQAEIIHVHDVMIWLLPWRLLFFRKKFILTMHGWEGIFPIPKKNIFFKKLSAWLANKVICVGDYIEKYYRVKADKVIFGGVDKKWLIDEKKITKKHQFKPGEKVQLLYVGRLAEDTGLPGLLKILPLIPEEKLEVIFAGDGALRAKCEKYGQVLGWQTAPQLQSLLHQAQLCFVGGYLSALEAMAAGCLALASFQHQLKKDYWQLGQMSDWVICGQPAQLQKKIEQYLAAPGGFGTQVKSNYQQVKEMSWERVSELYEGFYDK